MTKFLPIDKMLERVELARDDSNARLFENLMYLGEMLTKIVAAGFIAAINNDRDRHRYQQLYRLVRADGIGEWTRAIEDTLTGPAAQSLIIPAQKDQVELTSVLQFNSWQYEAVSLLDDCVKIVDTTNNEALPTRVAGKRWFPTFTRLRNKTRGHGAVLSSKIDIIIPNLEKSIMLMIENLSIFKRPWAYLYKNLSGKYRIAKLTPAANSFDILKTQYGVSVNLPEGVYISRTYAKHILTDGERSS